MKPGGRARRPEDKEARKAEIADAARAALDTGRPYGDLTMDEVLAPTGLSKGTAYLYFPSKEALFLHVLMEDLAGWFEVLVPAAQALPLGKDPAALAPVLADTLLAQPRLIRLLGLLHAVLEPGADLDTALRFKRFLAEQLGAVDAALAPFLPGFQPGDVARLLLVAHALVVGLEGMASPAPAVAQALEQPDLRWLKVDFRETFTGALAATLRGWRP